MEQIRSSIAGVMNQEFNKTLDAKPAEEKCIETPEVIEELYFFGKEVFHVEKPSKQNCAETNSFHHFPSTTKTPMHAAPESVPVASQHWNHRNVHEMLIEKKQEIRHQSAVSTVGIFEFSPGTAISSQIKQCTETSECCVRTRSKTDFVGECRRYICCMQIFDHG